MQSYVHISAGQNEGYPEPHHHGSRLHGPVAGIRMVVADTRHFPVPTFSTYNHRLQFLIFDIPEIPPGGTYRKSRNRELTVIQNFTTLCLAALTETRDNETGEHILRCQHYVKILAEILADNPKFSRILNEETIDLLYRSATLHDIGRVGIPDSVLLSPDILTDEEYGEMKKHTLYGRQAIQRAERIYGEGVKDTFLQFGKDMAYYHHERWDGFGYPEGLMGEDIPLFGRIMAVADVYDALICKRRYKPSFSHEEAVSVIARNRGTQFDPSVVDAFLEVEKEFRKVALQFPDT